MVPSSRFLIRGHIIWIRSRLGGGWLRIKVVNFDGDKFPYPARFRPGAIHHLDLIRRNGPVFSVYDHKRSLEFPTLVPFCAAPHPARSQTILVDPQKILEAVGYQSGIVGAKLQSSLEIFKSLVFVVVDDHDLPGHRELGDRDSRPTPHSLQHDAELVGFSGGTGPSLWYCHLAERQPRIR